MSSWLDCSHGYIRTLWIRNQREEGGNASNYSFNRKILTSLRTIINGPKTCFIKITSLSSPYQFYDNTRHGSVLILHWGPPNHLLKFETSSSIDSHLDLFVLSWNSCVWSGVTCLFTIFLMIPHRYKFGVHIMEFRLLKKNKKILNNIRRNAWHADLNLENPRAKVVIIDRVILVDTYKAGRTFRGRKYIKAFSTAQTNTRKLSVECKLWVVHAEQSGNTPDNTIFREMLPNQNTITRMFTNHANKANWHGSD